MPRLACLSASTLTACTLAVALLTPSIAAAQAVPPPDTTIERPREERRPYSAFERRGMHGIEVELLGGVQFGGADSPVQAPTLWNGQNGNAIARGAILDPGGASAIGQGYSPYGVDPLAFGASLGYRFLPYLSVGAFFTYAQYSSLNGADSGDAPDSTSRLSRQQWNLGAYARYYFTFSPVLQPWVSLGIGYNGDIAVYSRPVGSATSGQPETGDYTLRQDGIVVPLTVGLDWRPAPIFSVGPTFGYSRVFPVHGCIEVVLDNLSPVPATNTCASPPVQNNGYGVVFGGIYAKVTIDPFTR
jgi:opacity protein-like surface antigen